MRSCTDVLLAEQVISTIELHEELMELPVIMPLEADAYLWVNEQVLVKYSIFL